MKATQPPASPGRASSAGKGAPPTSLPSGQPSSEPRNTPPADHEFTETAQLLETGIKAAHAAPGTKQEKLEALKRAIADGSYEVDAAEIADKIVEEHRKTPLE